MNQTPTPLRRLRLRLRAIANDILPTCAYCGCRVIRPVHATYSVRKTNLPTDVDENVAIRVAMHASCSWYQVMQPGRNTVTEHPEVTEDVLSQIIPR